MSQALQYNIPEILSIGESQSQSHLIRRDPRFYYFVLFAILLHSLFLISVTSSKPRRLGSPEGIENAISVSLVNSQDTLSKATVEDLAAGPSSQTLAANEKKTETKSSQDLSQNLENQKIPKERIQDSADTEKKKLEEIPPFPTGESPAQKREKEKNAIENTPKKSKITDQKPSQSTNQEKKLANLDLSQPKVFAAPAGGGGAGVQRPPGITRSGENDDFARGVIRALQQTMPQLSNTFGRVTVRVVLDKNGGLVTTDVLSPSKVPGLDQSVVFATRQSSFPLPPLNANSADLTFFVTYIYR